MNRLRFVGYLCIICIVVMPILTFILPMFFYIDIFSSDRFLFGVAGCIIAILCGCSIFTAFRNEGEKSKPISFFLLLTSCLLLPIPIFVLLEFLSAFIRVSFELLSMYCLCVAMVQVAKGNRKGVRVAGVISIILILLGIFLNPLRYLYRPQHMPHSLLTIFFLDLSSWSVGFLFWIVFIIFIAIYLFPSEEKRKRRTAKRVRKPPRKPRRKSTRVQKRWVPSKRQVTVAVCTSCGSENNPTEKSCWNCGHSIKTAPQQTESVETTQHCVVCSGEILADDRVVLCPSCRTQGHRAHLLEYVRVHAACPDCGQSIRPAQLIPTA